MHFEHFTGVPHCSCMPPSSVSGPRCALYLQFVLSGAQSQSSVCFQVCRWRCLGVPTMGLCDSRGCILRASVLRVWSILQILAGQQPQPHDVPEAHLHWSSLRHEHLWRMLPCHSAVQIAVGRSAADLAYRLASKAALSADVEHTAQGTKQSAQRSGGHLRRAHESVLLWIRHNPTGSSMYSKCPATAWWSADACCVTSACMPLLSAVLNSKWHCTHVWLAKLHILRLCGARLLPAILHGMSH